MFEKRVNGGFFQKLFGLEHGSIFSFPKGIYIYSTTAHFMGTNPEGILCFLSVLSHKIPSGFLKIMPNHIYKHEFPSGMKTG